MTGSAAAQCLPLDGKLMATQRIGITNETLGGHHQLVRSGARRRTVASTGTQQHLDSAPEHIEGGGGTGLQLTGAEQSAAPIAPSNGVAPGRPHPIHPIATTGALSAVPPVEPWKPASP